MNNILACKKQYINVLKKGLREIGKNKKTFISDISNDIDEYINNHSDVSYISLCEAFGYPEVVAKEFIRNNDYTELIKKVKKSRRVKIILLGLIILFIVVAIILYPHIESLFNTINITITD